MVIIMRQIIYFSLVMSALLLFGCTQKNEIANPASVFCEEQGGTLEITIAKGGGQLGLCTLKDGTKCEEWAYFRGECPINYKIAERLDTDCDIDMDCETPDDYLIRSSCPYTTKCLENKCTVVCPIFDGEKYLEVRDCGECPQLMPAAPDFCKDGVIVPGEKDECGCQMPPSCDKEN